MTSEELQAEVVLLRDRVDALTGAVFLLLSEREDDAMMKAGTILQDPRRKAVDYVGAMVRPWLMLASSSTAREVRAFSLDEVVRDLERMSGAPDGPTLAAGAVREHGIAWEEIGVGTDGRVDPDALPPPFGRER